MAAVRLTGIVTRFSNQKGFGFIKPVDDDDDGTEDVFVHQSEVKSDGFRALYEGQKVEFCVSKNGDRYQAVDVTGPGGAALDGGGNKRNVGAECYNCGRVGHMARDCDRTRDRNIGTCYTCGMIGHIAKDCDRNGGGRGGGGGACYTCGMTGHKARDCDRSGGGNGGGGGACFTCGGMGHMARECTSERRGGGGGGSGACYSCGLPGHMARDCLRESGGGGVGRSRGDRFGRSSAGGSKCYNCGEVGHFSRECSSPAVK